jgi:hypothetical protein
MDYSRRRCLSAILVLSILSLPLHAFGELVAYWKFDQEQAGQVPDVLGRFPGTLSPTGATIVPNGITGYALRLSE